ncbi:STAS domain-containing protein [Actinomadura rudentiformis]|uniref:Anti-sigma factor antagonist n=2 Tax=Actinomadura rudentiformis TaxID=359158 RepID=A0A6H9Z9U0_9ACTN|nr:STAS domain-containing protein [Actinomadura rudentiformis]
MSHQHLPGHVTVVVVAGNVDLGSAGDLAAYLDQTRRTPGEHLVLDLAEVRLIDSTGLQVLVNAHLHATAHHATLRLASTGPQVTRVLNITQLNAHIGVHATVEDALTAALTRQPPPGSVD